MKKLKWKKNWNERKIGEVSFAGDKSAENFVSQGYAEYVNDSDGSESSESKDNTKIKLSDNKIDRIKQFEKFYHFLNKNAPEGYRPWFFPCEKRGKNPSPAAILKINSLSKGSWHHESARLSKEQCIEHIKQGYNLGISAREGDPLIIGDIDKAELINQIPSETLTVISRKREGRHFFGWDKDGTAKINLPTNDGEIRSKNQYVLAPGSYVPFNLDNEKDKKAFNKLLEESKSDPLLGHYTVENAVVPREMTLYDLPIFFKEKESKNIEIESEIKQKEEVAEFKGEGKYSELFKLKVSDILGKIPSNKRVGHPLHESETDANFSLSKDGTLGHCWRHLVSLNAVQFLCTKAGYRNCEDAGTPHEGRSFSKIKGDKKALEVAYKGAVEMGLIKEWEGEVISQETKEIDLQIEKISKIKNLINVELELKKLKKKSGLSIKILRGKVIEKKKKYLKENPKEKNQLPSEIDERFYQEDLLVHIWKELSKDHIQDDREKLALFIVAASGYLPNPKDHTSAAVKGNPSAGKDNAQLTVLKHFPKEDWARATRITQSEMEDRINSWKILAISEINKHREGANSEITETFKQIMEDGLRIFKKDNITGESKEIQVEQKTGFYGTTETEIDEELESRYVMIPIRESVNKNKAVVKSTLEKYSDINSIFKNLEYSESWIVRSIRGLDSSVDVVIPFANELNKEVDTPQGKKELFDYTKERVKRDVKRLLSLTKAIAWLFQKRRAVIKKENKKVILAEPTDFLTALKIFTAFFNISYSGLDPRIEKTLQTIKDLYGTHSKEIVDEFGTFDTKADWVIRNELQKEMGIESVNTIKDYITKLKDKRLIEVFWEQSRPKFYLIKPVNRAISGLLDPITLIGVTGTLTRYLIGNNIYKLYNKEVLDNIQLPDFDNLKGKPYLKKVDLGRNSKIDGCQLTGVKFKKGVQEKTFCESCSQPTTHTTNDIQICEECSKKDPQINFQKLNLEDLKNE